MADVVSKTVDSNFDNSSIAITGMGAATALGLDVETIWQAVRRGASGAGAMSEIELTLPVGSDGCQAIELPADFEPALPREARYLRWAILNAMKDSGSTGNDATRRGLVVGTTLHGMRAAGRFLRTENFEHLKTFLAGDTIRLACRDINLPAGSATTCSACASSLSSIALGITLLQTGQADQVIAGGYDAISEYVWAGFNSLRLVADGPTRPFARGRRGMKIGEGYAIVVLERLTDAQSGAQPFARSSPAGKRLPTRITSRNPIRMVKAPRARCAAR